MSNPARLSRTSGPLLIALTLLALSHLTACGPAQPDEPIEPIEPIELIEPSELADSRPECRAMGDLTKDSQEIDAKLAAEDRICFQVELAAADFLHLMVQQYEVDVAVRLRGPGGQLVVDADRVISDSGPEPLLAVVEAAGIHEVEIEADSPKSDPGRITLRIEALRPADEADRRAATLFADLRNAWSTRTRQPKEALPLFLEIMGQAKAADEDILWAEAAFGLGFVHLQNRAPTKARETFNKVVKEGSDDAWIWKIMALDLLAVSHITSKEPAAAAERIEQALVLEEGHELRFQRARLYQLLGQARQQQGATQLALNAYRNAKMRFRPWEERNLGWVLHQLGVLHRQNLGRPEEALKHFKNAAKFWAIADDQKSLAATINQVGAIHEALGEPERAAESYRQALSMRHKAGEPCSEANTLVRLAQLDLAAGHAEEAAQEAERARMIVDRNTCPQDLIAIRLRLAELAQLRGQPIRAKEDLRASLHYAVDIGDRDAEMLALVELGKLCRDPHLQCTEDPLSLTDRALEIVEGTRSSLAQEDHRLAFGSRTQALFDLRIDLQWTEGDYPAAFTTAEQARARALRDRLRQADAGLSRGVSAPILEMARQLRYALIQKESERLRRAFKGGLSADERAHLKAEVDDLIGKLNEAEAAIESQAPAFFKLMRAEPVGLATLQGLLDPNTVLLVYRLGETRSYLWLITRDAMHKAALPARDLIETEAEKVHAILTSRGPTPGAVERLPDGSFRWLPGGFLQLANQVLPAEITPHLMGRRLAIVADGILETIPFAVLPDPTQPQKQPRPFIENHVIFYLPSASVWEELKARPEIPPGKGWLAAVGDPAYGAGVQSLGGSRREVEEIRNLLPAGAKSSLRVGRQATKESVLRGDLQGYPFVHFAVHGEVHPRQPALSYLAFANVDSQTIDDGRLYAHELYDLDLPAELVVLAACGTGIGPRIPGEGLVSGLSRGFFYAGARRVMASLWQIPDNTTSELMIHFYRPLFAGADPAESLQQAQIALYNTGHHPNSWAGFVLQGP